MFPRGTGKAKVNESKYPYIVELAVKSGQLDFELGRRIMEFHKSRHIRPRHGRAIVSRGRISRYSWCFSDLSLASSFLEQFQGEFRKPAI
jgi:hypothetical protein